MQAHHRACPSHTKSHAKSAPTWQGTPQVRDIKQGPTRREDVVPLRGKARGRPGEAAQGENYESSFTPEAFTTCAQR